MLAGITWESEIETNRLFIGCLYSQEHSRCVAEGERNHWRPQCRQADDRQQRRCKYSVILAVDQVTKYVQVAYLMADISDVNTTTIKDLYERLESLPCENTLPLARVTHVDSNLTSSSPNHDPHFVLDEHRLLHCNQLYVSEPRWFNFDELTRPFQRGLSKRLYMQRSSQATRSLSDDMSVIEQICTWHVY